MNERPVCEMFAAVCEYGLAMGAVGISKIPGRWNRKVDERWEVWINPHAEEIDGQPGRTVYVEFNGWPAGVFGAFSGQFAAGSLANEETFLAALKAATPAPTPGHRDDEPYPR